MPCWNRRRRTRDPIGCEAALSPERRERLDCPCAITGYYVTATAFTVSVAAPLLTVPAELLTTTANCAPLSEAVVAGVV